jgi:CRISPR-associated protein (TIGR03984 family)
MDTSLRIDANVPYFARVDTSVVELSRLFEDLNCLKGELSSVLAKRDEKCLAEHNDELEKCALNVIQKYVKEHSFVYWQSADKADFGYYSNGAIRLKGDYQPRWYLLEDLRIFNDQHELHIWASSDGLAGRFRADKESPSVLSAEQPEALDQANCFVQTSKLWGTKAKAEAEGFSISEKRGMELWIPVIGNQMPDPAQEAHVFLKEHHYLGENAEDGFIKFIDRRFVALLIADSSGSLEEGKVCCDD